MNVVTGSPPPDGRAADHSSTSVPVQTTAVGFWSDTGEIRENWAEDKRWEPGMPDDERARLYDRWGEAVTRTFDWA